ncbi:SHOCT-like domain-containing protein [Lederbergia graminis]|uniref:YvlB/LiaX N-terminal domain-containing protein n=1 Tax=Lederbergia graminis TaxID=735518 RepID=A0ABW0LH91_9BACI|nr:hypothetical protein [Paenibacillus bovis]HLU22854.1 hypothetical protein [Bacillaceae bacterium]
MKDEISKVLAMVQEGKLGSDEATELINALKEKDSSKLPLHDSEYLNKTLKIKVESQQGDKVNVNLPLRLIHVALKSGLNIAAKIPEATPYVKDIDALDVDLILSAIENELDGQIVDVTSAQGDIVSVVIE